MFLRVAPEGREKKGSPVTFKGRRVLIFLLFPFSVGGANHFPLLLLSISFSPHPTFHEIQIGATLCEGGEKRRVTVSLLSFFFSAPHARSSPPQIASLLPFPAPRSRLHVNLLPQAPLQAPRNSPISISTWRAPNMEEQPKSKVG